MVNSFDDFYDRFSHRFAKLRKESGKTLDDISRSIGISKGILSKWETGNTEPKAFNIIQLANYFHVSTDYLLGISENPAANIGVESVAQYIHLSEDSVNKLHQNDDVMIEELLDFLIKDTTHFEDLRKIFYARWYFTDNPRGYVEKCADDMLDHLSEFEIDFFLKNLLNDPLKIKKIRDVFQYDCYASQNVNDSLLQTIFEERPYLAGVIAPANKLDLLIYEIYPYRYQCVSLLELKRLSKQMIENGEYIPNNRDQEMIGHKKGIDDFYRYSYGRRIIDNILQNRPKEESTDE